jgi:hypothetical protein
LGTSGTKTGHRSSRLCGLKRSLRQFQSWIAKRPMNAQPAGGRGGHQRRTREGGSTRGTRALGRAWALWQVTDQRGRRYFRCVASRKSLAQSRRQKKRANASCPREHSGSRSSSPDPAQHASGHQGIRSPRRAMQRPESLQARGSVTGALAGEPSGARRAPLRPCCSSRCPT